MKIRLCHTEKRVIQMPGWPWDKYVSKGTLTTDYDKDNRDRPFQQLLVKKNAAHLAVTNDIGLLLNELTHYKTYEIDKL